MKRLFLCSIAFLVAILVALPSAFTGFAQEKEKVYVINVKSEITPGLFSYIKSSLSKAEEEGASLVLFDIDTYGGRIDSAVNISDVILESDIKTVAYINKRAISAGVLVSISCDNIYMAPGATIGSAETIPATEKNISYWKKQLKTVAEEKGRDTELVMAMADKDIEIEGVVEKGKLLNLTTEEALKLGFIDGKASSRGEVYRSLGIESFSENVVESTPIEDFINIISSSYVAPLLLALGFIGLVVEIITPGFGIGGLLSIIGFSLFFMGSIMGGNAHLLSVVLFIAGIAMLIAEAAAPGFGVFGVLGIAGMVLSIVMASSSLTLALVYMLIALVLTVVVVVLIFKKLPKRKLAKTLLLDTNLSKESGFIPAKEMLEYIDREGRAVSFLRPSGKIEIDNNILDAVSDGEFIQKDELVKVIRVEGSKIIVRKKGEE
ncbi:putative membrane bound hydrolase YqeZ [Peptoclostridium acidaminophilum DSM 3953]|uniref:Putative membrane bound hydrolase YqeZ n=1 Tax=Peptoclostridium acidaminophilum DSM 3953 TaxID=1286171 RepID=W8T4P6_PEPAC|nr:nodulation protein NfeD [Peptoclostridium acidaminophilum]AHM56729.1 putative membrane bound hydrolase YqeZ [Peptoclostridium acidaminophilum DSM 3953]